MCQWDIDVLCSNDYDFLSNSREIENLQEVHRIAVIVMSTVEPLVLRDLQTLENDDIDMMIMEK